MAMHLLFFKQRLIKVFQNRKGVAFIEFAISVPLLLIMFYGAVELTRFILIVQKAEKTVDTLTDVITQAQQGDLHDGDVLTYLAAAQTLMNPYAFVVNGNVILTDVKTGTNPAAPTVNWQVCGGGALAAASLVSTSGSPGSAATLPPDFTMIANEEALIGELFYDFKPLLNQTLIVPAPIYRVAVFKPRYGTLNTTQTYVPCT